MILCRVPVHSETAETVQVLIEETLTTSSITVAERVSCGGRIAMARLTLVVSLQSILPNYLRVGSLKFTPLLTNTRSPHRLTERR